MDRRMIDFYGNDEKIVKRSIDESQLILNDIFRFTGKLDMEVCNVPFYEPIKNLDWEKVPNLDPEWIFMLNRHDFMVDLALSYRMTKEEKYLKKWLEIFNDWDMKHVEIKGKEATSCRTIDTGIRCSAWIKSLIHINSVEKISKEEDEKIKKSLKKQVDYLYEGFTLNHNLSNWGILQVSGMIMTFLYYPDITTDEMKKWCWDKFNEQIDIQFYEDGFHWEQSPLYHFEVLHDIFIVVDFCKYLKIDHKIKNMDKMLKAKNAAKYMIMNTGNLLALNDSDPIKMLEDVYLDDKVSEKVYNGNYSGNLIFKTDKMYLSQFNGLHGSGHGHGNLSNIILNFKDEIFVDPSRYTYLPDFKIRESFKLPRNHNTILVDDYDYLETTSSWDFSRVGTPISTSVKEKEDIYIFEGNFFDDKGNIYNRTSIILEDIETVLIYDRVNSIGKHKITSNFNIDPSKTPVIDGDKVKVDKDVNIYFVDSKCELKRTIVSDKYNSLKNNYMVKFEKEFENSGSLKTIITNKKVKINKDIIVKQTRIAEEDKIFKAIEIEYDNKVYTIYLNDLGTQKADELFMDQRNDRKIYGNINIFKDGVRKIFY